MAADQIREHLRRRIVADVHLGRIKPGGRLPSLREVSTELGVSIRAAARAYSDLQSEGLVSVRGRSGIYLVLPPTIDIDLDDDLTWYAEMLSHAWVKRFTIADLTKMLGQLTQTPMSVACVESTADHMEAFCAELANDFALLTTSVLLTDEGARVGDEVTTLYDAIKEVDFVVTTAFHAIEVRAAADIIKKPVVIVSANDTLVDAFENQLESGRVTIIGKDPLFVERFNNTLKDRFDDDHNLRVVLIEDVQRDPSILEGTTPLYTRAARRELNEEEFHLLPPPIPFLSAAAARKVVQCIMSTHSKRTLQIA
ncbi:MAG TPA: winged helix-turn-helix domain-containing protein [Longimicrobiales bacterium]|nr:winged helix-turn-helix domain-containing protein [Longimicrobiales bacterium]